MALHLCCPKRKISQISSTMARTVSSIKKKGEVTYDIRRLAHPRKRLIVHYNRLKPFLQASPHGEQEPSEEEEEKGTPSEEQESRGEEINKEPQPYEKLFPRLAKICSKFLRDKCSIFSRVLLNMLILLNCRHITVLTCAG